VRNRRTKPCAGRDARGVNGCLTLPRPQPVEPSVLKKLLVVISTERRRIDARAVGQLKARPLASRFAVSNQLHDTSTPPSIGYAWPVTNAASSEHRYSASDATSSGVPIRPIGWYAASARNVSASRPV